MTSLKSLFLLRGAKLFSYISKKFNLGAGGTWPGEIALRLDPYILANLAKQLDTIVLVAGTNGKTTTSKMVITILESKEPFDSAQGKQRAKSKIIHNETGANLLNGITSTLIKDTDKSGKLQSKIGVFEVDENALPQALKEFTPSIVVLLNLFRDQLDRYGEVDLIAEKWLEALKNLPKTSTVIINADDPHLAFIGKQISAKVKYFGISDKKYFLPTIPHAVDTLYCPNCGKRLDFSGHYLSHLGEWRCRACRFEHPKNDLSNKDVNSPLPGLYNIYNTLAATLATYELNIDKSVIKSSLQDYLPAFGRQEEFDIDGKKVKLFLSKNPAGFNASLGTVLEKKPKAMLLVLNDRIPDGRDVSWIWDVDFEMIPEDVIVITSGDRVWDMALRTKYAQEQNAEVKSQNYNSKLKNYENLEDALRAGLNDLDIGETLYVLPTYSAMLEVRKILGGRKIL